MYFNDKKDEKTQEWFESQDQEVDFNEINKANIISRYTKAVIIKYKTSQQQISTQLK